jgi:hypothetical protein
LTTFSGKKCLSGKVICAFFCPAYRSSPVPMWLNILNSLTRLSSSDQLNLRPKKKNLCAPWSSRGSRNFPQASLRSHGKWNCGFQVSKNPTSLTRLSSSDQLNSRPKSIFFRAVWSSRGRRTFSQAPLRCHEKWTRGIQVSKNLKSLTPLFSSNQLHTTVHQFSAWWSSRRRPPFCTSPADAGISPGV